MTDSILLQRLEDHPVLVGEFEKIVGKVLGEDVVQAVRGLGHGSGLYLVLQGGTKASLIGDYTDRGIHNKASLQAGLIYVAANIVRDPYAGTFRLTLVDPKEIDLPAMTVASNEDMTNASFKLMAFNA